MQAVSSVCTCVHTNTLPLRDPREEMERKEPLILNGRDKGIELKPGHKLPPATNDRHHH